MIEVEVGSLNKNRFSFYDLFAGIGGFHLGLSNAGFECAGACELDRFARLTYQQNFERIHPKIFTPDLFEKDVKSIEKSRLPDFDLLVAGFPCQSFSQVGRQRGFDDARGTLFFEIAEILKVKKPRAYLLENVQNLINHDGGRTFSLIRNVLTNELGYSFRHKVIRASDFGLPQNRPRVFMVGFLGEEPTPFSFPIGGRSLRYTMSDILGGDCPRKIGYTLRVGGRGSPLDDRRNWDNYLVDGVSKRIGPKEGLMMQGFPDWYSFPTNVSETQAMKQLGNSVAVDVVEALGYQIKEILGG